ncbi:MAG: nucleoside-diphosphate kinase [Elusimicrobiota bacterium]
MDKTLIIVKPDAFSKSVIGKVISKLEETGLKIMAAKTIWMNNEQAEAFYAEHKGKGFYEPLVVFMSSNPVMVMVWGGDNAVIRARCIIGATDPADADEGTIREQWAQDGRHNIIHGSDSAESAEREIGFFFSDSEDIFKWEGKEYRI